MMRPILFRGGMHGDLILGMLDPTSLLKTNHWKKSYGHSICSNKYIKYTRTYLKKFFLYNDKQKHRYYETFNKLKKNVYFLTHDTDFSQLYKYQTTQIVCSDLSLLNYFAERFKLLHRPKVIDEAKSMIINTTDFVKDYESSLKLWQNNFIFPNRFDIKNLFNKDKFLYDLKKHFKTLDQQHAEMIYKNHMQNL